MTRAPDPVEQTLQEWRQGCFVYGESDCMLSIFRYVGLCGLRDVSDRFRGRYSDHESALRMMHLHGGVSGLMELTGAVEVDDEPQRGDVVELLYDETETIGSICTGGMLAARLERGVAEVSMRFVRWRGVWRPSLGA